MSYNYSRKAKQLIKEGHLQRFETVNSYLSFSPALILHFDNHSPIAVEKSKWKEYSDLITATIADY
jgi:hypothetical protein